LVGAVERREDSRRQPRRAAAVDELEQGMHVRACVAGQRGGEPPIESRPFQAPPAPCDDGDQVVIHAMVV